MSETINETSQPLKGEGLIRNMGVVLFLGFLITALILVLIRQQMINALFNRYLTFEEYQVSVIAANEIIEGFGTIMLWYLITAIIIMLIWSLFYAFMRMAMLSKYSGTMILRGRYETEGERTGDYKFPIIHQEKESDFSPEDKNKLKKAFDLMHELRERAIIRYVKEKKIDINIEEEEKEI